MVFIFSCLYLIQWVSQSDDLVNADKTTGYSEKILIANTIDFIINNRQKIDLTKIGMPD